MHLTELLEARTSPAAGVYMAITRRCPLSCEHCSTNSTTRSEQYDGDMFAGFARTFLPEDRPKYLLITGGEPLVRPHLVDRLIGICHDVGTEVYLISGMYFADNDQATQRLLNILRRLNHFSASLDVFHERQVKRESTLKVLRNLLDYGVDVSIQLTGIHSSDPYLEEAIDHIRTSLEDRVPIFVTVVGPNGRAKAWLPRHAARVLPSYDRGPCAVATWPVVTFDGCVVACCNQDVVDGRVPSHLMVGHVRDDPWTTIRERMVERTVLRAIRTFGPIHLSQNVLCDGGPAERDYCSTCQSLPSSGPAVAQLEAVMARPTSQAVERLVGQMPLPSHYGVPSLAHLLDLGRQTSWGERRE